jgi:hypothetical protein
MFVKGSYFLLLVAFMKFKLAGINCNPKIAVGDTNELLRQRSRVELSVVWYLWELQ